MSALPHRVLVTGAAGFLGRALTDRLRSLDVEVVGVDLVADPARGIGAGDITRPGPWQDAFAGCDAVLHTAATVSMVAAYDDAWRVNVVGTRHALDAARVGGVARFVHFSSVAVFGTDYPDGVDESYPVRVSGRSSYADTKVGAEAVALAAHARGETAVTVVRPGDVYGPGSVWIREPLALLRARRMLLPDGGRGMFAPVYVDDLVEGVLRALTREQAVGEVITLGPSASVPCADYFGRLAGAIGRRVPTLPAAVALPAVTALGATLRRAGVRTEIGPASLDFLNRPGSYSIAKAGAVLDWQPRTDLDTGMAASLQWARGAGLL
ncbi:nucleoside-diphosphate-sugar epimerase [Nocardioides massiliensis]|uniref:Nucleoside-diphosphate-sugar epimerase n=3 Tax=Nocardioides massiliensis TaxID=1325935 RepID=A0ABT9NU23_9ACTN|nr:NAD(P)-dependent oxidoreductase [Nocardioides massiliensis]MDP9823927.1 nucleoside-diphosphate-sugar epimerase [Nocardioides massiliensis]